MEDSKKSGKKRQPITIEMKKEIIKKYEEGVTLTQLGRPYDRSKSTINTIVKDKDKFKAATASHGITKLVKTRNSVTDEMEDLLMVWIRDRQRAGDSISELFIFSDFWAFFVILGEFWFMWNGLIFFHMFFSLNNVLFQLRTPHLNQLSTLFKGPLYFEAE